MENYKYLEETIALKSSIEESFLELGKRLALIRSEQLWRGSYEDWVDFLSHAKLSESTASKLVSIFENLSKKHGISSKEILAIGDWSNAYVISTLDADTKDIKELVHKGAVLNRADLMKEVEEFKTGKPQTACPHEDTYKVEICKDCGRRIRVYDEADN